MICLQSFEVVEDVKNVKRSSDTKGTKSQPQYNLRHGGLGLQIDMNLGSRYGKRKKQMYLNSIQSRRYGMEECDI